MRFGFGNGLDLNSCHDMTKKTLAAAAAAAADCWYPWQPSTDWSGGLWQRKRE